MYKLGCRLLTLTATVFSDVRNFDGTSRGFPNKTATFNTEGVLFWNSEVIYACFFVITTRGWAVKTCNWKRQIYRVANDVKSNHCQID